MLPLPNLLIHSLKDRMRDMRYAIRAEAEAPGSALPKAVRDEIGPLLALGSVVGAPALRLADGLFTRLETIATGILAPPGEVACFPCSVGELFASAPRSSSFSDRLYEPIKELLRAHSVRQMLVSEHALDMAWAEIKLRHADTFTPAAVMAEPSAEARRTLVHLCAGIACAVAEARPIRKVVFDDGRQKRKHFLLAPNLYCGMVIGLSIAIVTLSPETASDTDAVLESVDSVVDARFDRFKQALSSGAPALNVAKVFEEVLPFLP